ncbi:MAG TPA: nuclear transport factor 2 family protein [Rhizomicrobium sp.]
MTIAIETLLTRNLFEVFDERDPARRRAAIGELYTEDCVFVDPKGAHSGHAALDGAVAALHEFLPGHVFRQVGAPQAIAGAGRLAWSSGPPGDGPRVTGLDLIVVRDGRIAALYTFLDPHPANTGD